MLHRLWSGRTALLRVSCVHPHTFVEPAVLADRNCTWPHSAQNAVPDLQPGPLDARPYPEEAVADWQGPVEPDAVASEQGQETAGKQDCLDQRIDHCEGYYYDLPED